MEKKFFTVGHKWDFFLPNKSGWGGIREMEKKPKSATQNSNSKNQFLCIILIIILNLLNYINL